MDNSMDKYLGKLLDNRYELLEVIGTGGMAVVYKAMCHRLNRYVAVKILRDSLLNDAEFRGRFHAESQAVAMLSHPNIVGVYDVSHSADTEYIVMELLDGVTLKQYMREKGALSWEETLHFAQQISSALAHAHSRGLVHRDIKPQNIMVLEDGNIKVADFGIAYLQTEMATTVGETIGSVHYVSPEQAKGLPVDARSDLYSLGIVMYEMLAGVLPFDCEDEQKVPLMHVSTIPEPLKELNAEIPDELIRITMKAMEPDLEKRYQSASELLADLTAFEKSQAVVEEKREKTEGNVKPISKDGELTREQYARRRRRAKTVSLLSGICGVLIFILFVGVFLWNYWLKDLFTVSQRIDIPNFVGNSYDIINSNNYDVFNFTIVYEINPDVAEGVIIRQKPAAGKSYMLTDTGIDVEIVISTGVVMYEIPNYVNAGYMEASGALEKMGFKVERVYAHSDSITEGYVISISPTPGEKLPAGSTVYLTVSSGPEVKTVIMPNLIGRSRAGAAEELESLSLNLMPLIYRSSDEYPEGTVIAQNVDAGLEVELHTRIYLTISTGPEKTEENG